MISTYTVLVTVKVAAISQTQAYHFIKQAIEKSKLAEIIYEDAEVTEVEAEPDAGERELDEQECGR